MMIKVKQDEIKFRNRIQQKSAEFYQSQDPEMMT